MTKPDISREAVERPTPEALIDLIGELGCEVFYLLDDCETSGPVGEEIHTITDDGLTKVSAVLDRIDELPFEEPGCILGTGALLQTAIKRTFVSRAELDRATAERDEARRRRDEWRKKAEGYDAVRLALREKVGAPWPPNLSRALWAGIAADEKKRADDAEARAEAALRCLRQHHEWHQQEGLEMKLGDEFFDCASCYCDSTLEVETTRALRTGKGQG